MHMVMLDWISVLMLSAKSGSGLEIALSDNTPELTTNAPASQIDPPPNLPPYLFHQIFARISFHSALRTMHNAISLSPNQQHLLAT